MKILVMSQYFWPETFRINEVVQSLREIGCDVTVLTGQPNYPEGAIQPGYSATSLRSQVHNGLTIHRVPLVPRGQGSALRLVLNYLSFVVSAAVFGPWLLRGRRFDVIFVYAPSPILQAIPAIWLKWVKSARLVTWVQDLWPESLSATGFVRNQLVISAVAAVVRWIYRKNDLLLVQSPAFVDRVVRMAGHTPVAYHPNPGEMEFSKPGSWLTCRIRLESGFNVVFAGNLGTVQALDTILAAAQLLQNELDIKFILVGSGSRSEWLLQETRRRDLNNVKLAGRFPPTDIPGILAQASAVLVSLARNPILAETVPSKLQAYLAAGKPIIASLDGEGARVVLEAGAGVACPAEDAPALARAVVMLRDAPQAELDRMAVAGRAYYELHFEPQMLAKRLVKILSDLTKTMPNVDAGS